MAARRRAQAAQARLVAQAAQAAQVAEVAQVTDVRAARGPWADLLVEELLQAAGLRPLLPRWRPLLPRRRALLLALLPRRRPLVVAVRWLAMVVVVRWLAMVVVVRWLAMAVAVRRPVLALVAAARHGAARRDARPVVDHRVVPGRSRRGREAGEDQRDRGEPATAQPGAPPRQRPEPRPGPGSSPWIRTHACSFHRRPFTRRRE
ncbi:hypothetical protein ACIRSU_33555 [Streptomyces sp. NPDC101160]|uniref:hypothetical protein n=1 Tax=Streptomyces sp. NPDC101160 TaxID=3366118 RepID=UPI0038071467